MIRYTVFDVGSLFYHGTSYPDFEILASSSWVTDNELDAEYLCDLHEGDCPRVLTFEVIKPLKLLYAETVKDFKNILEEFGISYEEDLFEDDYIAGQHELAELICDDGRFNGWHSPNQYPHGGSDTLICEPEKFLEAIVSREL